MRSDRHPPIPSPRAKVIDQVGHERVGVDRTRSASASGGKSVAKRAENVERVVVGQLVIPIAVFFLETPWSPLNAAASADIEAAVDIRRRIKPWSRKSLRSVRGVPGAGEVDG